MTRPARSSTLRATNQNPHKNKHFSINPKEKKKTKGISLSIHTGGEIGHVQIIVAHLLLLLQAEDKSETPFKTLVFFLGGGGGGERAAGGERFLI